MSARLSLSLDLPLVKLTSRCQLSTGHFVLFLTVLVVILRVFLGGPIWRLFEHFGFISWPLRDLFMSLRWLTYRRGWENSNIGGEVCVT